MYNQYVANSARSALDSYDPDAASPEYYVQQHVDLNTFLLYYVGELTFMDIDVLVSSLRQSHHEDVDSPKVTIALDHFERAPDALNESAERLLGSSVYLNDLLLRIVRLASNEETMTSLATIRTRMRF